MSFPGLRIDAIGTAAGYGAIDYTILTAAALALRRNHQMQSALNNDQWVFHGANCEGSKRRPPSWCEEVLCLRVLTVEIRGVNNIRRRVNDANDMLRSGATRVTHESPGLR